MYVCSVVQPNPFSVYKSKKLSWIQQEEKKVMFIIQLNKVEEKVKYTCILRLTASIGSFHHYFFQIFHENCKTLNRIFIQIKKSALW